MADATLPQKAVDLANERWGRIDSLIVNHGTLDPVKKVADSSAEEWRKGFDVNVFSAVGMVRWAFSLLLILIILDSLPVFIPAQTLRSPISISPNGTNPSLSRSKPPSPPCAKHPAASS